MGLDMYLEGRVIPTSPDNAQIIVPLLQRSYLELGYWRGNWPLHHLFMNEFGDVEDSYGRVAMSLDALDGLLARLIEQDDKADYYKGVDVDDDNAFELAESEEWQALASIKKIAKARIWLMSPEANGKRCVEYHGSW